MIGFVNDVDAAIVQRRAEFYAIAHDFARREDGFGSRGRYGAELLSVDILAKLTVEPDVQEKSRHFRTMGTQALAVT